MNDEINPPKFPRLAATALAIAFWLWDRMFPTYQQATSGIPVRLPSITISLISSGDLECRILTNHAKVDGHVLNRSVLMLKTENQVAAERKGRGCNYEPESLADLVGPDGDDKRDDEGTHIHGHREDLGADGSSSKQTLDDGGGVEGIAVANDEVATIHETSARELGVLEVFDKVAPFDLVASLCISNVVLESSVDIVLLFLGQPGSFLREIWNPEETEGMLEDSDW